MSLFPTAQSFTRLFRNPSRRNTARARLRIFIGLDKQRKVLSALLNVRYLALGCSSAVQDLQEHYGTRLAEEMQPNCTRYLHRSAT